MRSPPRRLAIVTALLGIVLPLLPAVPAQAQNAATWALINVNSNGSPSYLFSYGSTGCVGVTGDWDGNGTTTVGVVRRVGIVWRWALINVNSNGSPNYVFDYGNNAHAPVTGDWSAPSGPASPEHPRTWPQPFKPRPTTSPDGIFEPSTAPLR